MDAALLKTLLSPMLGATALATLLSASGCCGPRMLSLRHGEPTCGAVVEDEVFDHEPRARRGIPVVAWPSLGMPGCLHREHWRARSSELAADFNEFLEPTPPPPAKPPHSRFHPLPTQPVFASRAEYAAPELLGITKPLGPALPPGELAPGEEIPIPVPDAGHDRIWHDLPAPGPPVIPDAPSPDDAPPVEPQLPLQQPPTLMPPAADPSRGSVAPASFLRVAEPNPLRRFK